MATNNYYNLSNFTHGGTQYGTQFTANAQNPAATYQATAAYGGQTAAPGQAYPPPGTDQYMLAGYTRPTAGQQQQQQQGYYSQGQATGYSTVSKVQQAARPGATSTVYPTYSANTTGTTSSGSYAGFNAPQNQQTPGSKSFTNYDAAVYNAVSAYAQGGSGVGRGGGGMGFKKTGGPKGIKGSRPMPKPQTLHYCDVCKISCAGPQTYKEHLDGQKHKKKEAAQKVGAPAVPKSGPTGLRCELCDVTCTGGDAYAAHIRGAKHQKVVKLHTKLGKPIPSDNPTVMATPASANSNSSTNNTLMKSTPTTPVNAVNQGNSIAKPMTPKISYMGIKTDASSIISTSATDGKNNDQYLSMSTTYSSPAAPGGNMSSAEKTSPIDYIEKDVQPVGQDYIEELRNEEGKVVSFNCKLCECRFNDPNAKEMHMKGRRHRLQYKKKVNPHLVVDIKPSSRQKKIEERRSARGMPMRKLPNDPFSRGPVPLMPPGAPRGFGPGYGGPGPSPFFIPPLIRRPETVEDRHVMAKHTEIYPQEDELQAIQKIVSNTEKALKFVSDRFAEEDCKVVKAENGCEQPPFTEAELQAARKLKGVMRVGHLAKGLLLQGDRVVEMVVLCSEKPTMAMLNRVFDCLPTQMEIVAPDEKYELHKVAEKAGIRISSSEQPKIDVVVTLTSPLLRSNGAEAPGEAQATQVPEPNDLLDKEKCLDALAALRHAKWFQARATTLQSCVIVIRILRDICRRVPAFQAMSCWAIELLAEKAINSAGVPVSPGEALRIVFEILASGLLLQFGPGLLDPCEKESSDAFGHLGDQAREDITLWSQQALRQIAFKQIHLVLNMEALPKYNKAALGNRKRRRDPSGTVEGDESDPVNDGKKDKKEDIAEIANVVVKSEVVA